MKTPIIAIILVVLAGPPTFAQQAQHPAKVETQHVANTDKAQTIADLDKTMRKIWEDHITYTRNYIISAVADLNDTDAVAKRLLKNQEDIGDAIEPYYGSAAGGKLTVLLKDHILIATEVVKAAKAGDKDQLASAQSKWSSNGKDIAIFLSSANPSLPQKTLENMLQKHLDLITGQIVARLNKDWAADINNYDEGHQHMLMFADMLVEGIAKQFPQKFAM
jgi:phage terminase Nu1 subunit (DNA packaging protein)